MIRVTLNSIGPWVMLLAFVAGSSQSYGQLSPEIGFMLPSGGKAGTTVDVVIGGYDWTPDMQILVHDPRIKLEIVGKSTGVLITEPPYWFGYKARGYAWPLPREFPAKLTIPADVPSGPIRWQVANANGASPVAQFYVGSLPEIAEDPKSKGPQQLPTLPVTVSGQIRRIEEIDRYQFSVSKTGPVTIEIFARRLNSPLHGMLKVRDPSGRVVLDIADTEGRDFATTMLATAGINYEISLHDLDFAGDRSYVYRLTVAAAPRVLAAYPAAGQRGQTRPVEFVGIGLATGSDKLESVTRDVAFPANADATTFDYSVQTEWGNAAPVKLLVSDVAESVKPPTGDSVLTAPGAVTGAIGQRFGSEQHSVTLTKGQVWDVAAQAKRLNSPLDLELTVFGPDGKQVATNDDAAGSTDSEISLTVPADGLYRIVVSDRSGKSGSREANYRLAISAPREDLELSLPPLLNVVSGSQGKLALKATRKGGFKGPIPVTISGLPAGVTAPENLVIPEGKNDLTIDLTCAADAAVKSSLCSISTSVAIGGQMVTRTAGPMALAMTMKPRIKLTPEGLDDVRKVHRGSTYLFPMLIERLEGYAGPITLEMTAKQQRHRQGLASDEFIVPPDAKRVEYPIFVPEWMETTKTSRMILNGAVQIPDPQGNVRTLLQRQELRFGILPEGALMKLSHPPGEIKAAAGSTIKVPLSLSIASELKDPIEISIVANEVNQGAFKGNTITLVPGQKLAVYEIQVTAEAARKKEQEVTVRAKALKDGRWPVISETSLTVDVE